MTVVVIAEDALMPAGDVTEVPRRGLPTTDLAATTMSADASDVPRASMSTATGTPSVAAPAVSTAGAATASTPAPVSHAERTTALQSEREDDRDAEG